MSTDTHAKFSPSQLPRIIQCPGSYKLSQMLTQTGERKRSSAYADEGTMLHEATEDALLLHMTELDQETIDKYHLTGEHVDAVNDVLDYVFALKLNHMDDGQPYEVVESQVSMAHYAEDLGCPALEDVSGTLDYMLIYPQIRHIYISDWKFGKGVEVFPESAQLKAYALGALKKIRLHRNFDTVTTIIGQPRLYDGEKFKSAQFTPRELLQWCTSNLVPALHKAVSNDPKFSPSEEACRFCAGKATCEARFTAAQQTAQNVFEQYATIPYTVNIDQLAEFYEKAKNLSSYIKGIKEYLVKRLLSSQDVPGYKLVTGKSIRVWKNEGATKEFFTIMGIEPEQITTTTLLSPAQMEKRLGKRFLTPGQWAQLVDKPVGAPTLALESDRRPEYDRTATTVFAAFAAFAEED